MSSHAHVEVPHPAASMNHKALIPKAMLVSCCTLSKKYLLDISSKRVGQVPGLQGILAATLRRHPLARRLQRCKHFSSIFHTQNQTIWMPST
jgi:hypothetical protein